MGVRVISDNEKAFIREAIKSELRVDGRRLLDRRKLAFDIAPDDSYVTVSLGGTRVTTVISAELEPPYPDRPSEGAISINVETGALARDAVSQEAVTEVARCIERAFRDSRAVDQEALCVITGRRVWKLRVDVRVTDFQGNLMDACCISALAGLLVCRLPVATPGAGPDDPEVTIHPPSEREPEPLTIHHLPLATTFGVLQPGGERAAQPAMLLDPALKEEAALAGTLTLVVNPTGDVCNIQKSGGISVPAVEVLRCVRLATAGCKEVSTALKAALAAHEVARVKARVRRGGDRPEAAGGASTATGPPSIAAPGAPPGLAAAQHVESGALTIKGPIKQEEPDVQKNPYADKSDTEEEAEAAAVAQPSASDEAADANAVEMDAAAPEGGEVKEEEPDEQDEAGRGVRAALAVGSLGVKKQPKAKSKRAVGIAAKRRREQNPADGSLDAIAAMIAGSGGNATELKDALVAPADGGKKKKKKKKAPAK